MPLPTPQRDLLTAVEIDLWDGAAPAILRLCDVAPVLGALTITGSGLLPTFRPCLYVPLEIGSRIVSDGLSEVMPGSGSSGGTIKFSLRDSRQGHPETPPSLWQFLDMHWLGREYRIYTGEPGALFSDYTLSSVGRVDDLSHDTFDVVVKVADVSLDLDGALVDELFLDDVPTTIVPEVLQGRPVPELRGTAYNIPAILINDTDFGAPLYFKVSRLPLQDIMEVRVGGIPWDRVAWNPVAGFPVVGQWAADLDNGRFVLGGITGGLDVRCDARSFDWGSITTAQLLSDFASEAGIEVNDAVMEEFYQDAPYRIGWWTSTVPVNRLDAFDELVAGVGGWWGLDPEGKLIAGIYKKPPEITNPFELPENVADFVLKDTIASLKLSKVLPPAWRVRVEHTRNWGPLSNFADAVREIDQQTWQEPGRIAPAWSDVTIKDDEPRAVDLPLVRSFVQTEGEALLIRDQISSTFSVRRYVYDVQAYVDAPELYSSAYIDYMMVTGFYRVLSVTRGYGSGPNTMQIWG